ncbi:MAG: tandem-95 repeat protein, partial [Verrucomicrobiaceae bacterium]
MESFSAGDVDGDGRVDVVDGAGRLWKGSYDSQYFRFVFQLLQDQPAHAVSGAAELADLNGDGRPDLVYALANGVVKTALYRPIDATIAENSSDTFGVAELGTAYNGTLANGGGRTLSAIRITSLSPHGTLTQGGAEITVGQVITAASIASSPLRFTPNLLFHGVATFTWSGSADGANFDAAPYDFNLRIKHVPQGLEAQPDSFTVTEGGTATVLDGGNASVLTNEFNGDSLTAALLVPPVNGTLALAADGTFTYTHNGTEAPRTDQFTYQVTDNNSRETDTAIVSITVLPGNDPPSEITFTGALYAHATGSRYAGFFLATDPDSAAEGLAANFVLVDGAGATDNALFAIVGVRGDLYSSAPISYVSGATRSVRVQAIDPSGATYEQQVSIPVRSVPVAHATSAVVNEDGSVNVPLQATNEDGRPITSFAISSGSTTAYGKVSLDGNVARYTPNPLFSGTDFFFFQVSDGTVTSDPAMVSITVTHVNHPPTADSGTLTVTENIPLNFTVTGSDPDNDPLTFEVYADGKGTITGTSPNFTFTPNTDTTGAFGLTVIAKDGITQSAPAQITGFITEVDYAPLAFSHSSDTSEGRPVAIELLGFERNRKPLTWRVTQAPANGTLSGTAPNVTYTPAPNFSGTDSFKFVTNNGFADSEPGTQTIHVARVLHPPKALPQDLVTGQRQPLAVTLTSEDSDGDAITYSITRAPAYGTLTGSGDSFTYTPAGIYAGADSFEFSANDGLFADKAVVNITV